MRDRTTWVYIKSEPGLWTVGFYTPDGKWEPESDWPSADKAAMRVHFLNGGRAELLDEDMHGKCLDARSNRG